MSGPLAQKVEHRTFNPGVEGSNPSWLTIFFIKLKIQFPGFLSFFLKKPELNHLKS